MKAENAPMLMFLSSLDCSCSTYQPRNIMTSLLLIEAENYNEIEMLEHLYIMSERGEQNDFFDETIDITNSKEENTHIGNFESKPVP